MKDRKLSYPRALHVSSVFRSSAIIRPHCCCCFLSPPTLSSHPQVELPVAPGWCFWMNFCLLPDVPAELTCSETRQKCTYSTPGRGVKVFSTILCLLWWLASSLSLLLRNSHFSTILSVAPFFISSDFALYCWCARISDPCPHYYWLDSVKDITEHY